MRETIFMLRGLTTMNLLADDVAAAVAWYTTVLETEPYFVREVDGKPAYVEFRFGDYQHELGILDRRFVPGATGAGGTVAGPLTYWHVDDVQAAFDRLVKLGATVHLPPIERGEGFVPASVIDPFGNVLGVMFNQHYLDILATRPATEA